MSIWSYSNSPPKIPRFYCALRSRYAFFEHRKDFRHGIFFCGYSVKNYQKKNWILGTCIVFYIGHIGHMVTVIYSWSFSNYLREGMDEGFNWFWFNLNRFCGGGPGGSIDARGRFLGACLFGVTRGNNFFAIRSRGCGLGLTRFERVASFATRFLYTCFFVFLCVFMCVF